MRQGGRVLKDCVFNDHPIYRVTKEPVSEAGLHTPPCSEESLSSCARRASYWILGCRRFIGVE